MKERLRAVLHHGIGYGVLRFLSPDPAVGEKLRSLPQPQVSFNYLGQLDALTVASALFSLAPESAGPSRSRRGLRPRLLEINCGVTGGELRMESTYSRNLHRRTTIERLAHGYLAELRGLIAHCRLPGAGGFTPSDFPLAGFDQAQLDRLTESGVLSPEVDDLYPLSPMQEGMLFHALYEPGTGVYCEQLHWRLDADLDPARFRDAWERVVERHGVLRTAFLWQGLPRPLQIVYRRAELPWAEEDWRELAAGEQEARLEALLAADRDRGFALSEPPLMRLHLVRLGAASYRVVWSSHHLLLDGWSTPLLVNEVFAIYQSLCRGEEIAPPSPSL